MADMWEIKEALKSELETNEGILETVKHSRIKEKRTLKAVYATRCHVLKTVLFFLETQNTGNGRFEDKLTAALTKLAKKYRCESFVGEMIRTIFD